MMARDIGTAGGRRQGPRIHWTDDALHAATSRSGRVGHDTFEKSEEASGGWPLSGSAPRSTDHWPDWA